MNLVMSKTELFAFSVHPLFQSCLIPSCGRGRASLSPAEAHEMKAPLPSTVQMFCLSCATRIFTVVTWPEPKFECGLFSSAAPICRSMLQQSQGLFKIRTQMPKTLKLQDAGL